MRVLQAVAFAEDLLPHFDVITASPGLPTSDEARERRGHCTSEYEIYIYQDLRWNWLRRFEAGRYRAQRRLYHRGMTLSNAVAGWKGKTRSSLTNQKETNYGL